jgi:acetate kinase
LAIDVFVHQARHWIGSFLLQLNGADALVFTGGMGENNAAIRRAVCANLDRVGIALDEALNSTTAGAEGAISSPGSPIKIMVIPTNEELVVAREVKRFLDRENARRAAQVPRQAGTKKPTRLANLKSKLASSK